jgi:hypothetical protein
MAGKLCTSITEEEPFCWNMGRQGLCCCTLLCPLAIYSPTGGFCCFCFVTNYLRQKAIAKYGVEEQNACPGSSKAGNTICNFCWYGFNYPCTLFQIAMSIEYWDQEDALSGDRQSLVDVQPA